MTQARRVWASKQSPSFWMSQPSAFCEDRPQRAHITRITSLTPTDKSSLESHLGKGRIALFLGRSTPWPGAAQTLGLHFLLGTHTCCDSPAGSCRVCGFLLGNSSSSSVSRAAGPTTCKDRGKALTERLSLCHGCPLPFIRGSALLGPSPPACGAADEAARVFARALLCNGMGLHVCACMWLHAGMGPHTCVLWANKPLWCFRESLNAFLLLPAAPRCHSLLLGTTSCRCRCFEGVRSAPSSVQARAGLSLVSGSSIPPLLASHWSEAALTHPRWPLIGDRQFHSAPAGLSLVNGIPGPPLASDW